MVDPRCPSCSARVPAEADWCSLCYASLRTPAPAPAARYAAPAYAAPADAAPVGVAAHDPLFAPLAAVTAYSPGGLADGLVDGPGGGLADGTGHADPASPPAATWPCRQCQAAVPIDLDACAVCGARFLGDGDVDLKLPIVGSTRNMTASFKVWLMIGGSVAIMAIFLVVAFLVGLVT